MPSSTSPSSSDRKANGNSKAPEQSAIEKSNPKRKVGEEIDDIFKTLGNKKKINKNKNEDGGSGTQKKKRGEESSGKKSSNLSNKKKKMNSDVDDDKKGKTTDGMTIYTAEELGIGNPDAGGMSGYTRGGCSRSGFGRHGGSGHGSHTTPVPAGPTLEEIYRYERGYEMPPWMAALQSITSTHSVQQSIPSHPIPDVDGQPYHQGLPATMAEHSLLLHPDSHVPDTQHPHVEEGAYAEGGQLAISNPSRPLLQLLPNGTFLNSHSIAREITGIFKGYAGTIEYRWTHLQSDEQEMMFNTLLNRFTLSPGFSKEHYRTPFVKLIQKRMNDIYYRARTAALKKCQRPGDYEAAKAFPPSWCTSERWSRLCDLFSTDEVFRKRSTAGKLNRGKQDIRSTSQSKSHSQIRYEITQQLNREPIVIEWWTKTHTKGEAIWSTPVAQVVMERYIQLFLEKYHDIPEDDRLAFDKQIWKRVSNERGVGSVSRNQGLHGLHPRYVDECSSVGSTSAYYGMSAGGSSSQPSQPCTDLVMHQRLEQLSQQMRELQDKLAQILKICNTKQLRRNRDIMSRRRVRRKGFGSWFKKKKHM